MTDILHQQRAWAHIHNGSPKRTASIVPVMKKQMSKKRLLTYVALAYLGAAALLVAAALSAEYGIDPLGKLTGINELNAQKLRMLKAFYRGDSFVEEKPFKTQTIRIAS